MKKLPLSIAAIGISVLSAITPLSVTAEAPAKAAVPAAESPDSVAAILNGKPITLAQVEMQIHKQPILGYQMKQAGNDPKKIAQVRLNAVNTIIERQLLLTAAKKDPSLKEEEIRKSVETFIKTNYGDEERLKPLLKGIGTTLEQFKTEVTEDFHIRAYLEKLVPAKATPSDEELKKLFDANPARYAQQESVRARHILRLYPPQATEEQKKAIKEKADALYIEATKPDADFAKLAKENSEDGSAQNGGDLGYFPRAAMVPEFEKATFALKPGEVSKPVETQFGMHIIKLEEHKDAAAPDFEKAKPMLARELEGRKRGEAVQAKLEELRKTAKIEIKLPQP